MKGVGQQQSDFIVNNNLICNDDSSIVDLSNLPGELTGTQTDLTLYGFGQYYDPEGDIEEPLLTERKKQKTSDVTPEKDEIVPKQEQSPFENLHRLTITAHSFST